MYHSNNSIIIGKGTGISKFLADNLCIKSVSVKDLKSLNFCQYENIIYTSADPSPFLIKEKVPAYLEKNLRSLYYILESDFKGSMIYISSVDAGSYKVKKDTFDEQIEEMFTPYSFSKFTAESLFLNHEKFDKCSVLRVGLFWPTKYYSNFFSAVEANPQNIDLNLNSEFYVTPYSLVLKFLKTNFNNPKKNIFGYLTSSNKISLLNLLKQRNFNNIKNDKFHDDKYSYKTRHKDSSLDDLTEGLNFNWHLEKDFNYLIAQALVSKESEVILPAYGLTN